MDPGGNIYLNTMGHKGQEYDTYQDVGDMDGNSSEDGYMVPLSSGTAGFNAISTRAVDINVGNEHRIVALTKTMGKNKFISVIFLAMTICILVLIGGIIGLYYLQKRDPDTNKGKAFDS